VFQLPLAGLVALLVLVHSVQQQVVLQEVEHILLVLAVLGQVVTLTLGEMQEIMAILVAQVELVVEQY
jgi:hypothetical protein